MMEDPSGQHPDPHETAGSSNGNKRKNDDGGQPQQRAKRNRYIAQACNECKRRKIKCNGESPCHRCGNLSLECVYAPNCCSNTFKDSQEFKAMNGQMQFLSHQVERLYQTLRDNGYQIESGVYTVQDDSGYPIQPAVHGSNQPGVYDSSGSPSQLRAELSSYQAPAGPEIPFDLAINGADGEIPIDKALEYAQTQSSGSGQGSAPIATMSVQQVREDPIWSIDLADAERLFSIYDEEIGKMYPILEPQEIHQKGTFLFKFLAASKNSGLKAHFDDYPNVARDVNANITKMVIANALAAETGEQNDLGTRLFQSVTDVSEKRSWEQLDGSMQILLSLIAMHHFQLEDEIQAFRTLGLVARSCLEKGLQYPGTYSQYFANDSQRASALNLFWTIYALDKQWSFATGQPPSIHDSVLDPSLPKPDESHPYLSAMVKYAEWSARIWHPAMTFMESSQQLAPDFIALSNYEITNWLANIPPTLRFNQEMEDHHIQEADRGELHRQVQLRLSISQLRLFSYRPIIQSSRKMIEHHQLAEEVVRTAQEMIQITSRISQHSMVVHTHPVSFYHFIASAIAVLLLAVCQRPAEYGKQVRDDFKVSLEFVKGFGTKSAVGHRLWRGVRSMSTLGSSLGSTARQALSAANDPHSSAAVAMAGLAGHTVDERAVFDSSKGAMGDAPRSGQQIAAELLKLFEAACEYGNAPGEGSEMTLASMYGGDQEFTRITRDIF